MKRTLLSTIAVLSLLCSHAQVRFGLKAGYNHTDAEIETAAHAYWLKGLGYSAMPGYHAGLVADFAFGEYFSVQPGLLYKLRGFYAKGTVPGPADGPVDANISYWYNYLELPLNFLGRYPLGPGKLFAGIGPSFSYGISGRIKSVMFDYWSNYGNGERREMVIFLDEEPSYEAVIAQKRYTRPFDIAAGATLGYEFNFGLLVSAGYQLGLTDADPDPIVSQKSRSWAFSIGYLFGSNR